MYGCDSDLLPVVSFYVLLGGFGRCTFGFRSHYNLVFDVHDGSSNRGTNLVLNWWKVDWDEFGSCLDGRLKDSWPPDLPLQEHSDIELVALTLSDAF